jgi:ribosomal protein L12E/L44/L45/RPP1/RPP2
MKCHNIAAYLIIPLAFFFIMSLFDNVQAQTNSSSTNQKTSLQQPNQNTNLIAQALMETDIVELMDKLQNAQVAIADGNLNDAIKNVRDVETELLLIEPSPPTTFLNNIGKSIKDIDKSNFDKSLDALTKVQIDILKAENLILKNVVAKDQPQQMQQSTNIEPNTDEEEDSKDNEEEDSKDNEEEDSTGVRQQFSNMETETTINEEKYYTDKEDT